MTESLREGKERSAFTYFHLWSAAAGSTGVSGSGDNIIYYREYTEIERQNGPRITT